MTIHERIIRMDIDAMAEFLSEIIHCHGGVCPMYWKCEILDQGRPSCIKALKTYLEKEYKET